MIELISTPDFKSNSMPCLTTVSVLGAFLWISTGTISPTTGLGWFPEWSKLRLWWLQLFLQTNTLTILRLDEACNLNTVGQSTNVVIYGIEFYNITIGEEGFEGNQMCYCGISQLNALDGSVAVESSALLESIVEMSGGGGGQQSRATNKCNWNFCQF